MVRAPERVFVVGGNLWQTFLQNDRDAAHERDVSAFSQSNFKQSAAIPRGDCRRAVEDQVAQRVSDRATVIKIEWLKAMWVGPDDGIDSLANQPTPEFALALGN